jgi:hypothetical protein
MKITAFETVMMPSISAHPTFWTVVREGGGPLTVMDFFFSVHLACALATLALTPGLSSYTGTLCFNLHGSLHPHGTSHQELLHPLVSKAR